VILAADGRLLAFVERGGRTVLTFSDESGDLAATADRLALLARRRMRRMVIGTVDGSPAATTPLGNALASGGFVESYRGMILTG
jgi:ATP-dependent Lhr-like helicase